MADDLATRMQRLRPHLQEGSRHFPVEPTLLSLQGRIRRAESRRRAAVVACASIMLLLAAAVARKSGTARRGIGPDTAETPYVLADGSALHPLASQPLPRWSVLRETPAEVTLRLHEGAARFEIARRPGRRFQVLLEDTSVTVVGTGFEVVRAGASATVTVLHGQVEVHDGAHQRRLVRGERDTLVFHARAAAPSVPAPVEPAPLEPATRAAPPEPTSATTPTPGATRALRQNWRDLARRRAWAEAYTQLEQDGIRTVADTAHDLALAGQVAAEARRPTMAVSFLGRVLDAHRTSPEAPVAALRLGHVLLRDLRDPRGASRTFATAQQLGAVFAADDEAAAIEALARAGRRDEALARFNTYAVRYPAHPRREALARLVAE